MAKEIEYSASGEIKASPKQIWEAIVKPEKVAEYHLAPLLLVELKAGGRIEYGTKDETLINGTVLEAVENQRLKHTFRFGSRHRDPHDEDSVVEYIITPTSQGATLTIRHTGFAERNQTFTNVVTGWPVIIEGLEDFLTPRDSP